MTANLLTDSRRSQTTLASTGVVLVVAKETKITRPGERHVCLPWKISARHKVLNGGFWQSAPLVLFQSSVRMTICATGIELSSDRKPDRETAISQGSIRIPVGRPGVPEGQGLPGSNRPSAVEIVCSRQPFSLCRTVWNGVFQGAQLAAIMASRQRTIAGCFGCCDTRPTPAYLREPENHNERMSEYKGQRTVSRKSYIAGEDHIASYMLPRASCVASCENAAVGLLDSKAARVGACEAYRRHECPGSYVAAASYEDRIRHLGGCRHHPRSQRDKLKSAADVHHA